MPFGISDKNITEINHIFASFPEVERVVLYGSRAKGTYKNGSDIDLSLIGKDINLKILSKIELAIDELPMPYIFDISIYNHIKNLELIEHIDRVGKPIYQVIK